MDHQGSLARRLVAALLLLATTACQTWVPSTMSARDLVASEAPSEVRVTRPDGNVVTIDDPVVRNDSIVSGTDPAGFMPLPGVPTLEISSIEVRRFNGRKTLLFAAAAVAIAVGWTVAATGTRGGSGPGDGPLPKVGPG